MPTPTPAEPDDRGRDGSTSVPPLTGPDSPGAASGSGPTREPAVPADDAAADGTPAAAVDAPAGAGATAVDAGPGQHAAPRPYPPSPTVTPAHGTATSGRTAPPDDPGTSVGPEGSATTTDQHHVDPIAPSSTSPASGTDDDTGAGDTSPHGAAAPAGAGVPAGAAGPATGAVAATGATAATPAPVHDDATRATRSERRDHDDVAPAPAGPGVGRHLLGILLGLVLTPVALLMTVIGTHRLLESFAGSPEPTGPEGLGLTLLVVGVVLLAVIALLALWSPAVPITGGVVWGLGLGIVVVAAPQQVADALFSMYGDAGPPASANVLMGGIANGHLVVIGTLLLCTGIVAGLARRSGRRRGEQLAAHQARTS